MLLVITPNEFASALIPFKTHKDQIGVYTRIVTLDEVYTECREGDEAERIKRYIATYCNSEGIRYVMLVGDADRFPVRYTKTDRKDTAAYDTAFYPTDLYYAALFKQDGSFDNWDANSNGYYGELNGETHVGPINVDLVNLIPTVAVGRIPADTVAEVSRYVQKVIRYEQGQSNNQACNALLIATDDWRKDACQVMERISKEDLVRYNITKLFSAGSPCEGAGSLTPSAVTEIMNSGVDIISYIGHGSPGALAIPGGGWGSAEIARLTNTDELPIMAVSACNTAQFSTLPPYSSYTDINGANHIGTNAGEVFTSPPPQPSCLQRWSDPDNDLATMLTVRTDGGAVAYFGGVTGIQMCEPVEYFVDGIAKHSTLGEAWQWMVTHFYDVQGQPGSLDHPDWFAAARVHHPWKYMLFGDPSLQLKHPPTLPSYGHFDLTRSYWDVLYGLVDDSPGGLVNLQTGKVKPVPPSFREILKYMLIHEVANTIHGEAGLESKRIALKSMIQTLEKELNALQKIIKESK